MTDPAKDAAYRTVERGNVLEAAKRLRALTGAGIMDCMEAINRWGDSSNAIESLRIKWA